MRIPGPAGEFQARRATWHREEREEELEQEERRRDDVRDGENIQNEKKRRREEEGERDHPRVSNATTTKRSLWQKLFDYSSSPSPNDDAKNHGDDSSLALFKQKQFQNIQWLKNGGWRSGRLSKGRFIVEKMKKVKRKSAAGTNVTLGGDQNDQPRASSLSSSASPFSVFDGSLLVSDENGDTITATCDGETLKMLLTHKNTTKKRGTRVGMIVRDVAVLNASATEQHLVFRSKSLVEVFFQEEVEGGGGIVEGEKGGRGKENAGAVAIEVNRVPEKEAPQPQQKAVSAFALQAMKLMEKRKAKAAAAAKNKAEAEK
jgi:hypothetical protein